MKIISIRWLHSVFLIALVSIPTHPLLASEDEPVDSDQVISPSTSLPDNNIDPINETLELEQIVSSTIVLSEVSVAVKKLDTLAAIDPNAQPKLELLGSSVEPGEEALLKWSLEETFVDNSTPVPVLVVNGINPGPTLCLTAAVHGDELNGIEIVRRIVHEVDPETLSGAVIGVPIVNLQGFRRANRYLPDRRDLNRYFPGRENGSFASRIAHSFFTNVIQHCNYLIDIHTGSLSRTNLPQIRANLLIPEVAALAEKMGSIVVLQSKGSTGTLRRATVEAGIPAVTLEAGAPNNLQKGAVEEGVASILSAMSSLGLAPQKFWRRNEEPVFYKSTWIRARQGGILFSKVELGDSVKKDTVLGLLSDPITNKTTEIITPIEGRVIGMALNQVMYPGFAAYHIGLKSSAVEAAQPEELISEEDLEATSSVSEEVLDPESDQSNSLVEDLESTASEVEKEPIEEMELPTIDNE
ncbi:MAG: succinylglutamate desuccinylase/aspartoacylase family protein [Acidiferrobacterales bacterium]|nr:succinylglutamate desuccinylase/aspartoacylase family protein [Acidiferrobacterales bacterium]